MNDVGLESLESRREKHKLILYYKMMNDLTPFYLTSLCPPAVSNDTYNLRNQADSQVPKARTSLYYDSFLPSTIRAYNALPLLRLYHPSKGNFLCQMTKSLLTSIAEYEEINYCTLAFEPTAVHFLMTCSQKISFLHQHVHADNEKLLTIIFFSVEIMPTYAHYL